MNEYKEGAKQALNDLRDMWHNKGFIGYMAIMAALVTLFVLIIVALFPDKACASEGECVCTRESTEKVCIAYYELLDLGIEGMDVKLVCKEKLWDSETTTEK